MQILPGDFTESCHETIGGEEFREIYRIQLFNAVNAYLIDAFDEKHNPLLK